MNWMTEIDLLVTENKILKPEKANFHGGRKSRRFTIAKRNRQNGENEKRKRKSHIILSMNMRRTHVSEQNLRYK